MGVEVESREVDAQAKVGVRNGDVEKKETSLVKWWKIDDASFSRFFNIILLFNWWKILLRTYILIKKVFMFYETIFKSNISSGIQTHAFEWIETFYPALITADSIYIKIREIYYK